MIVLLVVFLSIKSDFEKIDLPMGLNRYPHAHTVFSLLFTTFIVVWLCQSPSKELATQNSIAFLKLAQFSRLWWPGIRMIGTVVDQIKIQQPSEWIVDRFSRLSQFRTPRDLRPSDAAYFLYGLKIFGYALFKLQETLTIEADGTSTFKQRGLFYVINDERKQIGRWYEFDNSFLETNSSAWAYFAAKPGENFTETLEKDLENAFSDPIAAPGLQKCDDPRFIETESRAFGNPQDPKAKAKMQKDYIIVPPVDLIAAKIPGETPKALAVGFEITFAIEPGGFKVPSGTKFKDRVSDFFHKDVNFPWRRYEFEAILNVPGKTQFENIVGEATVLKVKNDRETKKMEKDSKPKKKGFRWSISYPLTGA